MPSPVIRYLHCYLQTKLMQSSGTTTSRHNYRQFRQRGCPAKASALAGEPHAHGQCHQKTQKKTTPFSVNIMRSQVLYPAAQECHMCYYGGWHQPTSDMVHMGSELRQLSVLQLSEGRRWAVLAGPALQPLAVLGAHTEHRQLLVSYLAWPPPLLLLLVGWTSSVA